MVAAAYTKFNTFVYDVCKKKHDLSADVLKIMLSNTLPVVGNTIYDNLVDLATGHGYTSGGTTVSSIVLSQTNGVLTLTGGNVIFTATSDSIGPFRYVILYNATPSPHPLIAFADYGSSISLLNGQTFTVDLTTNTSIFTLQ